MPYLQLPTKRIHYTSYAPSNEAAPKATLLCMHGLGSSQNFYGPIVPALIAEGYCVVTFDTAGAGRSPYTFVEQSIERLGEDVIDIIEGLELGKVVFVGHSMAGIVAAHLPAICPSHISASIMIGPVRPSPAAADAFSARIAKVEKEGMEAMANTVPSSAVSSTASPLVKAFIRELLLAQDPAGYVSNCRIIAGAKVPRYEDVKCPVLLIAGDEDKSAPLEGCRGIFEALGSEGKEMVVLERCGHWHCLEKGDEVAKEIIRWLGKHLQ